jgi:hypothetical protein
MKRTLTALLLAVATLGPPAPAAAADALSGMATPAETPFVNAAVASLTTRFATPADAEKAGYLRYTDEDDTGAISYANRVWTSTDAAHPSQLWYDAKGRLIGADYSIPYTPGPPHAFGLDPSRFTRFGRHIHYGLAGPNGTTIYGSTSVAKLKAAGGDPANPTPKDLVAEGIAKSPADVRFVFEFPAIWDAAFWLIPNPNGPFADKNPLVHPVNPKPEA